ncbi:uncharacterized protein LOC144283305 isoform X1 [Canis aureus]
MPNNLRILLSSPQGQRHLSRCWVLSWLGWEVGIHSGCLALESDTPRLSTNQHKSVNCLPPICDKTSTEIKSFQNFVPDFIKSLTDTTRFPYVTRKRAQGKDGTLVKLRRKRSEWKAPEATRIHQAVY